VHQYRLIELAQIGPRLDPELLDEDLAGMPIDLQRVRLAAAAVQREHQHRVEALTQRLDGDEPLELRDHLAMPAALEVVLDRELKRRQPQLLQPPDLRARERHVGHIIERRAAPQSQRLAQRAPREQALEALRIDRADADAQLIAMAARDDLGAVHA
jgi:hypothetical protein